MPDDGKRAVQPKRNEWGYPDTYSADNYDDRDPGSGPGEWPDGPVPDGKVQRESLNADLKGVVGKAESAVQPAALSEYLKKTDPLDGTKITVGSLGKDKLATAVQTSLGKADTALQAGSALDGSKLTAKTVAAASLADVVTSALLKSGEIGMKQQASIPDLTAAPTMGDINTILGALRRAGLLAPLA